MKLIKERVNIIVNVKIRSKCYQWTRIRRSHSIKFSAEILVSHPANVQFSKKKIERSTMKRYVLRLKFKLISVF